MGNILGKKKKSKVTEHDRAVLDLKTQRDKLTQAKKRVTKKIIFYIIVYLLTFSFKIKLRSMKLLQRKPNLQRSLSRPGRSPRR